MAIVTARVCVAQNVKGMADILRRRHPLQIVGRIVRPVAVLVVHLVFLRWPIAQKCCRDQMVNGWLSWHSRTAAIKAHIQIPRAVARGPENPPLPKLATRHPPQIRDAVVGIRDVFPVLVYALILSNLTPQHAEDGPERRQWGRFQRGARLAEPCADAHTRRCRPGAWRG